MRKLYRIFISRYAVSALFIIAELFLISYLIVYAYSYSLVFVFFTTLVDVLVIISLINRDTNPEFKLTWLAVVTLVPIIGGALYLIFYNRHLTKKEAGLLSKIFESIRENEKLTGDEEASIENLGELARVCEAGAGRALSLLKDDAIANLYTGSVCTYYKSGEDLFVSMLERLESAKKYIFLEYFIVEDGELWEKIYKILKSKAEEGIEIRMLYDDIGSMSTVPKDFSRSLRKVGISAYPFARVSPRVTSSHNNRDHRKICVIDGEIAFTGGVNIADEYINLKRRFGHWKDGGISVEGAAARGFARLFLMMYDFTVGEVSDYSHFVKKNEYTKALSGGEFSGAVIPFGSGPKPTYPEPVGKNALMNIIEASSRYLYITTPYLIIDYDLTEALRNAAKRGVDVRMITPAEADKKIIKIMTKSAYPYLLQAGVRIFEYTPGFIHEKLVVCDDAYAIVGTINFDYRSLVHHFEDGAWIYGSPAIKNMRDGFLETEGKSGEIAPCDAKLGIFEKAVRSLIKIFAPLL
ncbi:MAG: cardiolipin synthase [Clostridia bacterium]|nr:cardiolipin synthase [Clostridia bacterium]